MTKDFGGCVGIFTDRKYNLLVSNSNNNKTKELDINYWYDLYQDKCIAFYFYKLHVRFKKYLINSNIPKTFNIENTTYMVEFRNILLSNKYSKISQLPGYCEQPNIKQFWIFRGWSENDAILKVSELQRNNGLKFAKKLKNNPELYDDAYPTRIGYWIKKGYPEDEAKKLVSERQRTFSLDICIQKNGKEEGTRIFNERQEKWQNTLNSKPQEEIDDMNRRKSSGLGNYTDRDTLGNLYYIHFYNEEIEFWKIGISVYDVDKRFGLKSLKHKRNLNYEIIFIDDSNSIEEAYMKEQHILKLFDSNRITINYNGFQTTEAFDKDVLKDYYNKDIHEKNNN